jgi:small neutral amino acid transporter SnatA (MarC family)
VCVSIAIFVFRLHLVVLDGSVPVIRDTISPLIVLNPVGDLVLVGALVGTVYPAQQPQQLLHLVVVDGSVPVVRDIISPLIVLNPVGDLVLVGALVGTVYPAQQPLLLLPLPRRLLPRQRRLLLRRFLVIMSL